MKKTVQIKPDSGEVSEMVIDRLRGWRLKIMPGRARNRIFYVKIEMGPGSVHRVGNEIMYVLPAGWRVISVYYGYTTGTATYTVRHRRS